MLLGSKTKIIIIDDDQVIVDQVTSVLNKLGVEAVDYALSMDSALPYLADNMYDFIVLDLKMPNNDGVKLINFIKDNPNPTIQKTPLLVMYGVIGPDEISLVSEFANVQLCKKPFTDQIFVEELLKLVETAPIASMASMPDQVDFNQACKAGLECVYLGELSMARNFIKPKLDKQPNSPRLNALMGSILFAENDLEAASKLIDSVITANRKYLPAINLKTKILVAQGSFDEALKYMETAQTTSPLNIQRLIGMGEIHLACGRPKMALEKFERALKICPSSECALIGIAKVKIEMGDTQEGLSLVNKLQDQGGMVGDINLRAILLSKAGFFNESVTLYDRAIKCCTVDKLLSKLHYNKAIAYIRVDKKGSAKDLLQDAIKFNPSNKKAKDLLDRLNAGTQVRFVTCEGEVGVALSNRQKQLIFGSMHTAIKNTEE